MWCAELPGIEDVEDTTAALTADGPLDCDHGRFPYPRRLPAIATLTMNPVLDISIDDQMMGEEPALID